MDNAEHGRRLMAMATEYLQDMEASYARESWNAVVRRAQEVVELSLQGVLSPSDPDSGALLQRYSDRRMMRGSHGTHSTRT